MDFFNSKKKKKERKSIFIRSIAKRIGSYSVIGKVGRVSAKG